MRKIVLGVLGGIATGAALLAQTATAHPNLDVTPAISCAGSSFTPVGIEGGDVTFDYTVTGSAPGSVTLGPEANGIAYVTPSLPPGFVGTASIGILAEGTTYEVTSGLLDCRTVEQPPVLQGPETTLAQTPTLATPGTKPKPKRPTVHTPGRRHRPTCAYLLRVGAGPRTYARSGHYYRCKVPAQRPPAHVPVTG